MANIEQKTYTINGLILDDASIEAIEHFLSLLNLKETREILAENVMMYSEYNDMYRFNPNFVGALGCIYNSFKRLEHLQELNERKNNE